MFYYLILIAILTYYILINKILNENPKLLFFKRAGSLLVISLALISLNFGIHSEVFSSHNKYGSEVKNSYNFFDPLDILKFPIEQYGINIDSKYIPKITVSEDSLIQKKTRRITIVIDKTSSTKSEEKYILEIKKTLIAYLKKATPLKNKINLTKLEIEDLFLLTALERIYRDKDETYIDLLFYKGNSEYESPFNTDVKINKESIVDLFKKCADDLRSINKKNISKRNTSTINTDFSFVLEKISSEAYITSNSDNNVSTSLIILSDFAHEDEATHKSFKNLNYKLQSLGHKINQINLIQFKGNGKYKELATRTINLFRKNFNHINFYEFNDALIDNEILINKSYPSQIAKMFSYSSDVEKSNPVIFYHSWNKESYNYDYASNIVLSKKNKSENTYSLGYGYSRNTITKTEYSYLINNNKKVSAFQYLPKNINKNETTPLTFVTNQIESKDYFLEFHKINSTYISRVPIVFKSSLPITTCIYLIFLYLFFGLTFSFIIFYFSIILFNKWSWKKKFKTPYKLCYSVILFSTTTFLFYVIIYFISNVYKHITSFIKLGFDKWNIILFIMTFAIFYIILIGSDYKKLKQQ